MDKIVWQLSADSSQVRSEMAKAVASSQQGGDRISQSWGRVDARQKSLLESNNRVTNQFQGFTRSLLSARSGADVLAAGLDRLENSLNLSLGAGFALAGGAVIIQQMAAARAEVEKLQKELSEIDKLANANPEFKTMTALEEGAKKAQVAIESLQKSMRARTGSEGITGMLGQAFSDLSRDPLFLPTEFPGKRDAEDLTKTQADKDKLNLNTIDKRREQSDSQASGRPSYEIEAAKLGIAFREANPQVHEMTQAVIELTAKLKILAQTASDKKMERAGASLAEMSARGDRSWQAKLGFNEDGTAMDPEKFRTIKAAQGVMGQRAAAESQRLDLNPEAAHTGFNAAGEAAEGMTGLKPSEKMSADFKGALAVSEGYLQTIAESKTTLVNK